MNKNTIRFFACIVVVLMFVGTPLMAAGKKPLIAKGKQNAICGITGISKTIRFEVIDSRQDKTVTDNDVLAYLKQKTVTRLEACGYRLSANDDAGIKTLKITLENLGVEKQPGKLAGRMDATATIKAEVVAGDVTAYNTALTATSSRTQPFVGHVIKKGKWALKLMDELADMVAGDSPLSAELVK